MKSIYTLSVDCPEISSASSKIQQTSKPAARSESSAQGLNTASRHRPIPQSPTHRPPNSTTLRTISTAPLILTDTKKPQDATLAKTSPRTSTSSHTPVADEGNGSSNLSKGGEIAMGIAIPLLGVLVALVFGLRTWNKRVWIAQEKERSRRQSIERGQIAIKLRNMGEERSRSAGEDLGLRSHRQANSVGGARDQSWE